MRRQTTLGCGPQKLAPIMLIVTFVTSTCAASGLPFHDPRSDHAACNGGVRLRAGRGVIVAPRLRPLTNNSSPLTTRCLWTISLQHENQLLEIRFDNFQLGVGKFKYFCKKSFLVVQGSGSRDRRFCRLVPVGALRGMRMVISIKLVYCDSSGLQQPFVLRYKAVSNNPDTQQGGLELYTFNAASLQLPERCHGVTVSLPPTNQGFFHSPGYPGHYDNDDECIWRLKVPENKTIRIDFWQMDVEQHERCVYDSVVVCDVTTEGRCRYIMAFCGNEDRTFTSRQSTMLVRLISDVSVTGRGFYANFSAVDPDPNDMEPPTGDCAEMQCGVRDEQVHPYIVGGVPVTDGQWPWMVRLAYGNTGSTMCGGTVLSHDWILTAAHCIYAMQGEFLVKVGSRFPGQSEDTRIPGDLFIHCDYDPISLNNDIALIRLRDPLIYSRYVWPVCLPLSDSPTPGTGVITGWGVTWYYGALSSVLRQAQIGVTPPSLCAQSHDITVNMFCAGDETRDSCQGDSGGPFLSEGSGHRWRQYGITSWGPSQGCAVRGLPGVYTKVTNYVGWIVNVTENCVYMPAN